MAEGEDLGGYRETSREAWEKQLSDPRFAEKHRELWHVLDSCSNGATVAELGVMMNVNLYEDGNIAPRMTALFERGAVFDTGERRLTPRGCKAIVWATVRGPWKANPSRRQSALTALEARIEELEEQVRELRAQRGPTQRRLIYDAPRASEEKPRRETRLRGTSRRRKHEQPPNCSTSCLMRKRDQSARSMQVPLWWCGTR